MLVLTRNLGDGVIIGEDVRVKIRSIKGKQVKLGIEAPPRVRVLRQELIEAPKPLPMPQMIDSGKSSGNEPGAKTDFRVLVVEDDPGQATLIQMAFTDYGINRVTIANSGEGALNLMAHQNHSKQPLRPHLILLDLGLPDISGLEVLRRVRSTPEINKVPVVMLSCSPDEQQALRCLDEGANAFVRKDVRFNSLQESVSRIADFWSHARRIA